MLSYILNRQYKKITECLPQSLQVDQPDTVYLRTYANPQLKQATINEMNGTDSKRTNKLKIKRKTKFIQTSFLGDCCPTCYTADNIVVKYYGKRHVCVNCRKFLRDEHGNQVKLFINKQGEITCLGIYPINQDPNVENEGGDLPTNINNTTNNDKTLQQKQKQQQQKSSSNSKGLKKITHKVYYHTDHMKLFWNGKSAFATFAAQDEMVVVLRKVE